jgi:predicted O-linked N-acetylglucosamine transferase (SPINDLY family)
VHPEAPVIFNSLAVALQNAGALAEAERSCRAAAYLAPEYGEAWHNLGNVLRELARPADAAEAHAEAARLLPEHPIVRGALAVALLDVGRLGEALEHFGVRARLMPGDGEADGAVLFWRLHDAGVSDEELFDAHVEWANRWCGLPEPSPYSPRPAAGQPLRVGYVSAHFRANTVARFFEPVLANHDPAKVSSICYSDVAQPDAVTARLRGLAGEWHDTAGMSDDQLAEKIRHDRIDILVDLAGHMGGGRLRVFAMKPAPVQATYLGYPHSTGVAEIDYRITDAASDPVGLTERFHVERLVRLEGCAWCYRPDEDSPGVTEPPAAKNGFVTFGSFNRMAKITPMVAKVWARVLDAAPSSRLLVLAAGGENNRPVRRMLEAAGVPGDRLELVRSGTRAEYLAHVARADVGLDPFPYNGMTTTCDLLWLGVPTVTLAGTSHRGRVGASLLGAVGLGTPAAEAAPTEANLVAGGEDEYVHVAAGLAGDVARLSAIRATLRERMAASPLCDAAALARKLEAAYAAIGAAAASAPVG